MGNSSEELKEIVKNVTLRNEEDGIYLGLKRGFSWLIIQTKGVFTYGKIRIRFS